MRRRMSVAVAAGVTLLGLLPSVAGAAVGISLDKTVVVASGMCPGLTNTPLDVAPGTQVKYCYNVTNNDPLTYTAHTLDDNVIGSIPIVPPCVLGPFGSGNNTCSTSANNLTPILADTTNVATWVAVTGTTTATGTDSAQVYVGPANDLCVSATDVASNTTLPFMTTEGITHATTESGEPGQCGGFCDPNAEHSVWYKYTAPKTGTLCAMTCGSSYSTVLAAFTSCDFQSLMTLACNYDESAACDSNSTISFPVTQGEQVYLRASSCFSGIVGNLKLTFDYCSIALTKTVSVDGMCPGADPISVDSGTQVTYCYQVANNGPITLTAHSLIDDVLGSINTGAVGNIPPGGSATVTATAVITAMTMNTATWTDALSDESLVATDSAKVQVNSPTPTETATPTPTATPTSTPTATATGTVTTTGTATATATQTPTPTNTPKAPVITGGTTSGSSTVMGHSGCVPGNVIIFDCRIPPDCHHCTDVTPAGILACPDLAIGMGTKDAQGNFIVPVDTLLQPGHLIYATDGCTDPEFGTSGPDSVIQAPATAPLLSPIAIVMLAALLGLVGIVGLARLRLNS